MDALLERALRYFGPKASEIQQILQAEALDRVLVYAVVPDQTSDVYLIVMLEDEQLYAPKVWSPTDHVSDVEINQQLLIITHHAQVRIKQHEEAQFSREMEAAARLSDHILRLSGYYFEGVGIFCDDSTLEKVVLAEFN
jgi:hypothetical protein